MADTAQPLTPLEFVELGNRITEKMADDLGIAGLIEDARLVVQAGLQSITSGLDLIGANAKAVEKNVLPGGKFAVYRWARKAPRQIGGKGIRFPEPLSVYQGNASQRRHPSCKAIVLSARQVMVLGDDEPDRVFCSWSPATRQAIGYYASYRAYWSKHGKVDPSAPVI